MRKGIKYIVSAALSLGMVFTFNTELTTQNPVFCKADTQGCPVIGTDGAFSDNSYKDGYTTAAAPVNSYLIYDGESEFTRVEYMYLTSKKLITEKIVNGKSVSSQIIEMELPLWGGFYNGSKYYYCVFGQKNEKESDKTEVLRVVKYDKNWKRISACSIYGANTLKPFEAGSLRMDESNGKLCIHTCHTMYTLPEDGLNHQANMTFVIDEAKMSVTQQYYSINNISKGYVSHSFNQFVKADGNTVYRVDHGDGTSRSVVLTRSSIDNIASCSSVNVLNISGSSGDNYTGVTVGGAELSENNCLISGSTVDQSKFTASSQKNIFLGIVDKSTLKSQCKYLTSYSENSGITVNTPKLVKINSNKFAVMWEECFENRSYTRFTVIDGAGNIITKPQTLNAILSDCQPVIDSSGNLVWYVSDNQSPVIYTLNPDDTSYFQSECSWNYDESEKTLTVSGKGLMWIYGLFSRPWQDILNEAEHIVVGEGITSVSKDAFCRMKMLKTVQLPEGIQTVGQSAFADCPSLQTINIPDSVIRIENRAFYGDNLLKSVTIGKNTEVIGEKALGYLSDNSINTGFAIYGSKGSASEQYASENGTVFHERPGESITDEDPAANDTPPSDVPEDGTVILNLNEEEPFVNRTVESVMAEYNKADEIIRSTSYISDSSTGSYYEIKPSLEYPYFQGVLKQDTVTSMQAWTNWFRWLAGSPEITVKCVPDESLQYQALDRNFNFAHVLSESDKPADMPQDLWDKGFACRHNCLAFNLSPVNSISGWINEGYSTGTNSWNTLGHRHLLIRPELTEIHFGYCGLVSIAYGADYDSAQRKKSNFYAFPAPGLFPGNYISATDSAWEIGCNNGYFDSASDVTVTITNLNTKEKFIRCTEDETAMVSYITVAFAQPDDVTDRFEGFKDSYKVEIDGLSFSENNNYQKIKIEYTVDFFDSLEYEKSNVTDVSPEKFTIVNIPEKLIKDDYLKKIALFLPDEVEVQTDSGFKFMVPVSGEWVHDPSVSGWRNTISREALPANVTDTDNIFEKNVVITYMPSSFYDLRISSDPPDISEGDSGKIIASVTDYNRLNYYLCMAQTVKNGEAYAIKNTYDTANTRYNVVYGDNYNTEYQFNIEEFNSSQEGEYIAICYTDQKGFRSFAYVNTFNLNINSAKSDVVPGDVNSDGVINMLDYIELICAVTEGKFILSADINGDGSINAADLLRLIGILAG